MQQSVLVDGENFRKSCEAIGVSLETGMGEIMKMAHENGDVFEVRVFVPHYLDVQKQQRINSLQCLYGLEVSTCPVLQNETRGVTELKECVDFEVLKWVLKHLHKNIVPNLIIFVTGDGHFLISSNEAKRKGKKTEFWSVDSSGVHGFIKKQERFRRVETSKPLIVEDEEGNPFLKTLNEFMKEDGNPSEEDVQRLQVMVGACKVKLNESAKTSSMHHATNSLSKRLGISAVDSAKCLEALMACGVVRVYPSTTQIIEIDRKSEMTKWLQR